VVEPSVQASSLKSSIDCQNADPIIWAQAYFRMIRVV
jgi:hypothetical protein